jgi:putative MATE family efflux protein
VSEAANENKSIDDIKENKMGTMPINKLLISMSLPMMISMLVLAMYNVVDSVFVSKISENALTAVSLVYPLQMFMIAVGSGIGVGINALVSRNLGAKDMKAVNQSATNGIFIVACSYIIFLLIGIFFAKGFITAQTKDAEIVKYGSSYLRICCVCAFACFTQMTFERLLQSTGKTIYTMITQLTGAVINIILDPIFIFGLFGAPRMEVAGAAIATITGQLVAGVLAIIFNLKKNKEIQLNFKGFIPNGHTISKILYIGIPSIIMSSMGSIMTFCMNKLLIAFVTTTAAAVFGVYFKLQSFVFMPVFGLNNGMVPIVAYNLGARNKQRLVGTVKLSMLYAFVIMLIGLAIMQTIPDKLLLLFNASNHMLEIGVPALKTISLSFIFAGFCVISLSLFQALGNGILSAGVSFARQLIVLIPVAYLICKTGHSDKVWYAFTIAEVVSVSLCMVSLRYMYKKVINKI